MDNYHPYDFYPDLSQDRLEILASLFQELCHSTLEQMSTRYDSKHTQNSAIFGRARNAAIQLALSGEYSWLRLGHHGMDFTLLIGEVPVRFFQDDSNSPKKKGFFKRNATDSLFEIDDQYPVMWRFVAERDFGFESEFNIFFQGYNLYQEKVCEWKYEDRPAVLYDLGNDIPASTEIPSATVNLKDDAQEAEPILKTGSNE